MKFVYHLIPTLFLASISLEALEWKIIDPCRNEIVYSGRENWEGELPNVGAFTLSVLAQNSIPFQGDEYSITSILNAPHGDEAIDIVSEREMFLYGWCYSVNDKLAEVMPGDYIFQSSEDSLIWFYGYSHFRDGAWLSMCSPSYLRPLRCLK